MVYLFDTPLAFEARNDAHVFMAAVKTYSGKIVKGRKVVKVSDAVSSGPLPCLDYFTPSFAWGYHGGACDELAIAILHDHFDASGTLFQERVLQLYRGFVDDVVSKFTRDGAWTLSDTSIARWIAAAEKRATVSV